MVHPFFLRLRPAWALARRCGVRGAGQVLYRPGRASGETDPAFLPDFISRARPHSPDTFLPCAERAQSLRGRSHGSHHGPMTELAARDAKNRFGHLLDVAQSGPVCVTRKGRAVGVMMSIRQYELLRGVAWEQLRSSMDALGREASGLTEAGLETLLADES